MSRFDQLSERERRVLGEVVGGVCQVALAAANAIGYDNMTAAQCKVIIDTSEVLVPILAELSGKDLPAEIALRAMNVAEETREQLQRLEAL